MIAARCASDRGAQPDAISRRRRPHAYPDHRSPAADQPRLRRRLRRPDHRRPACGSPGGRRPQLDRRLCRPVLRHPADQEHPRELRRSRADRDAPRDPALHQGRPAPRPVGQRLRGPGSGLCDQLSGVCVSDHLRQPAGPHAGRRLGDRHGGRRAAGDRARMDRDDGRRDCADWHRNDPQQRQHRRRVCGLQAPAGGWCGDRSRGELCPCRRRGQHPC
ncbi:hypothetical protein SAMN05444389_101416 [Paracoccus solventivorans]|uniref:Uncharacterized protein n=1 Tax=Paracoccus solventivorans TaxID=53463 RepID=A0A1M7DLL4_9RHOB|nr:hypothetical protein SAMN05444389_101416 [Paracoccus solventivorans]